MPSQSHMLPAYARVDLAFERGEGAWLIATNGDRYLDFASGVAVNALGQRIRTWSRRSPSRPRRSGTSPTSTASRKASGWPSGCARMTFADKVFFANSGAEAMECAIKMVRKYQSANGHPERYRIITFEGAFHGRTLATLAAAGNKKYLDGFGPADGRLRPGSVRRSRGAQARHHARDRRHPRSSRCRARAACASAPPQFFRELRELCDEHGLLLIFDEVQTGIGRTGELFGYQKVGVTPDVMALAKGLGGGFPIGAVPGHRRRRPRA